jgi:hypothetical protein
MGYSSARLAHDAASLHREVSYKWTYFVNTSFPLLTTLTMRANFNMFRLSSSLLLVAALASADLNFTNWQPPRKGDLRAPCPAMNSLANHNFINHDGTNITVDALVPILGEVFHWSTEVATIVSQQGLASAADPSKGTFTLGDLNTHNIFEHDASLSRADYYFGEHDDHTFRQDIFDQFLSFFDGQENVTLETAGAARYKRVEQSRADNPTFTYGETQQFFSYAETIFYFRGIVDPVTKACPVAWVKILFGTYL